MRRTLGERAARRDEASFAGRATEESRLETLLADESAASIAFVHGPAGIGKSTLLRRVARRAAGRGWSCHYVEGRELAPAPDVLADALEGAREEERPLIVLDGYERMTALGPYLRRALLPDLPETAAVLIGSRHPPEGAWLSEGWQGLMVDLELGPLAPEEGAELLRTHGVESERTVRAALTWSGGSPLALALAAEGARPRSPDEAGATPLDPPALRALVSRLIEDEFDSLHVSALNAAAVARVTTPDLLRDAVPGLDAEDAYRWLEARTFVEPLGEGLALHELVRRALREDLRVRDPERERELRRRIADHLYARARSGDRLLIVDLAHLAESPAFRWGFSWSDSSRYRIDDVRPEDRDAIAAILRESPHEPYWQGTQRFFAEAPEHVVVVRDAGDRLAGYGVAVTPTAAPSFCVDDPILGPWLEHAAELAPRGDAVLYRDSVDFSGDSDSNIIGMLGMAGMLRSALENPHFAYVPINPRLPGALEFGDAMGGRHVPDLDVQIGPVEIRCYVIEYGPGGLLAAQRDLVYRELGLPPPAADAAQPRIDFASVRDALRNVGVPQALAHSNLAAGEGQKERAESVRRLLTEASDQAFGEGETERLLRRVLERGYLDPAPSHELAARELHLSRSAYFRRLRTATARVADYLAERQP